MDLHPSRLARALPKLWKELGVHALIEECLNEHPIEYDPLAVEECLMFEVAIVLRQMGLDVRVIERRVSIIEMPGTFDAAFTRPMRSLLADGVEWDTEGSPDLTAVFNRWETGVFSKYNPYQIKVGEARDITNEVDQPSEALSAIIAIPLKLLVSGSLAADLTDALPENGGARMTDGWQKRL